MFWKYPFFQLKKLSKLNNILSNKDLETVIHTFISMQLNCCNALGISESLVTRLQLAYVQNSAARLLTNTRKRDNITPVLVSLHWLPVKYWIQVKVLMFVYKALHDQAPEYIRDIADPLPITLTVALFSEFALNCPAGSSEAEWRSCLFCCSSSTWNALPLSLKILIKHGHF